MTPSDFAKSSATLGFAHNALDRLANRRDDDAFQAGLAASPGARTLAVVGETVVVRRDAEGRPELWFAFDEAASLGRLGQRVFLGVDYDSSTCARVPLSYLCSHPRQSPREQPTCMVRCR